MSYTTIYTNQHTIRYIHENRATTYASGATGFTSVKVGEEEVIFNVAIDPEQLDQMAHTAARNKIQQCKDGALLVEIVSRKRL